MSQTNPVSQEQDTLQYELRRFSELMRTAQESLNETRGIIAAMHAKATQPRMRTMPRPEVVVITTDKLLSILSRLDPTPIMCEGRVVVDIQFAGPLREKLAKLMADG